MVEIAPQPIGLVDSNRREIHNVGIPKGNSLMDSQAVCQAGCPVADIL